VAHAVSVVCGKHLKNSVYDAHGKFHADSPVCWPPCDKETRPPALTHRPPAIQLQSQQGALCPQLCQIHLCYVIETQERQERLHKHGRQRNEAPNELDPPSSCRYVSGAKYKIESCTNTSKFAMVSSCRKLLYWNFTIYITGMTQNTRKGSTS
jgi:hypothetical protein